MCKCSIIVRFTIHIQLIISFNDVSKNYMNIKDYLIIFKTMKLTKNIRCYQFKFICEIDLISFFKYHYSFDIKHHLFCSIMNISLELFKIMKYPTEKFQ